MSLSTSPKSHVSQPTTSHPRDVQVAEIAQNTRVLRSRTWDRLKFEVEYGRRKGTTANSYLIQSDRTALIDPPGQSFTSIYLAALQQQVNLATLDYIIVGHVNPNRMATLAALVNQASQAVIICSRPAANTIRAAFPGWDAKIQTVRPEMTLDLGQGHCLQFIAAPTPRWPDGLCTYDPATQILYSDKLFGAHVCDDAVFDENWRQLEADRRYYFDCLHAPQAKQVEAALAQFAPLTVKCYAPGHGPLVRYSLSRFSQDYDQWCKQQASQDLRVVLFYASAYGSTAAIAGAIAQGLIQSSVAVEAINCELADPTQIKQALEACDGFIIGSPTLGGHAPVQIQTALGLVLSNATRTKLAGVFGSYGWSGEAIDLLEQKLRDANYRFGFEPIRVQFSPDGMTLQMCEDAGAEFAQQLRKQKKRWTPRQSITEAQADRTEQAVGRIIGSLCVLTTREGDTHSGVLTSWVSQASFSPPGLMITVSAEQHANDLTGPGATFVLNILKEGRAVRRHFSYHAVAGTDPFAQLNHHAAANGCLILDDALAYLECSMQSWSKCGDHWLIYALVNHGEVLEPSGSTAMQQRKSGSCY